MRRNLDSDPMEAMRYFVSTGLIGLTGLMPSMSVGAGQGKVAYRKRKWIAEPPNGWLKNVLGFRQFSLGGLAKCNAELKLVCMALNLRRMCAMGLN